MIRNLVIFYGEELLAPRPTPKLEDHPLSAVRNCLFKVFAATVHIRRPFLHSQPEDAPCRGDRTHLSWDQQIKTKLTTHGKYVGQYETAIISFMRMNWAKFWETVSCSVDNYWHSRNHTVVDQRSLSYNLLVKYGKP